MAQIKVKGKQVDIQDFASGIASDSTAIGSIATGVVNDAGATASFDANYLRLDGTTIMSGNIVATDITGGNFTGSPLGTGANSITIVSGTNAAPYTGSGYDGNVFLLAADYSGAGYAPLFSMSVKAQGGNTTNPASANWGGSVTLIGGYTMGTGWGGNARLQAGEGKGTNSYGGTAFLEGGSGNGNGTGGDVQIVAGAAGGAADGGDAIIQGGSSSTGTAGKVIIWRSQNGIPAELAINTDTGNNTVGLKSPASLAATITYTLPGTLGTTGQSLTTTGSGIMVWTDRTAANIVNVAAGNIVATDVQAAINELDTDKTTDTAVAVNHYTKTESDATTPASGAKIDKVAGVSGNIVEFTASNAVVDSAVATSSLAPLASPVFTGVPVLPPYTLATLPTVVVGGMIFVTDANSGAGAMCYGQTFGSPDVWVDVTTGIGVA